MAARGATGIRRSVDGTPAAGTGKSRNATAESTAAVKAPAPVEPAEPESPAVVPPDDIPTMSPTSSPTAPPLAASVTAVAAPPYAPPLTLEPPPAALDLDRHPTPPPDGRRQTRQERKATKRMRARKVRRVVRHVDPWSVLKLSLFFYFCLLIIVMVAGVILWNIARQAGTIDDLQNLFKDLGLFETFTFEGDTIFRAAALGGLVLVIAGTGVNVLFAVLFNLISDLVGGIRITVIEEETARPVASGPVLPAGARPTGDRARGGYTVP